MLPEILIFVVCGAQYLKEGLSRIDEGWAAARFDSLPHVVHILTSKDREGEIQFLKEQSDLIEDVVDEVVHAYHHGFNKAIQNYSQVPFSPLTMGLFPSFYLASPSVVVRTLSQHAVWSYWV